MTIPSVTEQRLTLAKQLLAKRPYGTHECLGYASTGRSCIGVELPEADWCWPCQVIAFFASDDESAVGGDQ